jgi:hypothetical protein
LSRRPANGDWRLATLGSTIRARDLPGLDLELLSPDDEDERGFLIGAQHPERETPCSAVRS